LLRRLPVGLIFLGFAEVAAGTGTSSFGEVEGSLVLSPMLVGGVEEEDCAFETSSIETSSIVRSVLTVSTEEARARVSSAGAEGRDEPPIPRRVENIVYGIDCRVGVGLCRV